MPTATSYYLAVMVPRRPPMGSRKSPELRTPCLIVDRLCAGQVGAACDLDAQRAKANEQSINHFSWDRAHHSYLKP